jgi:WD40 repeat protein/DNA-binding SARP family transcriptional activator
MPRSPGRSSGSTVEFGVLGPLVVHGDDGPIGLSAMERVLLARLVAGAGRTVSTDELIDTLWGETPPRAAGKALQNHVLRLRKALEPDRDGSPTLLVTDRSGYRLDAADDAIDARRFERLVGLGRRAYREGRIEAAAATLADALAMWRGPAFADLESTGFGGSESRRLGELRLVALEDRIAADLDLGRARETIAELEALVHEHPLRERLWQLLVLALYRANRQADALAAYSRARDVLVEELGVEPSADLRRLQVQVLDQDDALQPPSRLPMLPEALVRPPGPFVGRVTELALLREAWSRVSSDGTAVAMMLRGPRGAGITSLAAELAAELAEEDVPVEYQAGAPTPVEAVGRPTLRVVDVRRSPEGSVDLASLVADTIGPRLTIVLVPPGTPVPAGAQVVDVGPLTPGEARAVLVTYVDDATADDVLDEVLRVSGGLPGRVHNEGLAVARRSMVAVVSRAAERAAQVGAAMEDARTDLREGVTRFREVIERAVVVDAGRCPWRGLVAYGVDDAAWFAGRERLVAELLTRMASARLVALVGGSGSGKSSLLHAGLLASLRAGALPGSESWVPLVMRPGARPMRELVREALRGADRDRDHVAELLERVVFDEAGESRVLLVVDQFEEVWTACTDAAERASFLDALAEVVGSTSRCTVVLGVRADHVAGLADQPALARAFVDGTVLVGTPTAAEVRRAVEHPARLAGLQLEVGLSDALVDDAGDEPGSLPLLSTALTELWECRDGRRLTLEAYVDSGGLRGAVARIAERAYDGLDEADRAAARVLLLRLAGPGEGDAVTRRRVPLTELDGLPDPRVRAVVEPLAVARLLTVDAGHVEVAHEALFREWPRLRAWLEEHAAARRVQRRLAVAAAEWDEGGREAAELWRGGRLAAGLEFAGAYPDEVTTVERAFLDAGQAQLDAERREAEERAATATRQNRRLRWLLGGLAVVLAAALVAGVFAIRAESRAEQEAVRAEQESQVATARELAAAAVANLETDPELAVLLARRAVEHTRQADGTVLPEAEEALHQAVVSSRIVATYPDLGGSVDWSRDGSMFVTEGPEESGVVDVRDSDTGESLRAWHGHDVDVNDVAFAGDGTLATTGDDGAAVAWDPRTGEEVGRIEGPEPEDAVWGPSFSADGRLMSAAWVREGAARVLDLRTDRLVREVRPEAGAAGTALSPDGTRLAVTLRDEPVIVVVDLATGSEVLELTGFDWGVGRIAWSPDGRWIAAAGDGHAIVWDATTGSPYAALYGHSSFVTGIDWSADSAMLATGGNDGTARLWKVVQVGAEEVLTLSSAVITSVVGVAFSPDGRRLMAADETIQAVTIFDIDVTGSAEWASVPTGEDVGFPGVDFLPDGRRIVASSDAVTATVWDVVTGRALGRTGTHGPPDDPATGTHVYDVDVSPDGTLIATASNASVKVWDAETLEEVFSYQPGTGVDDVAWSRDGSLLAVSGSETGMTPVLDRTGRIVGQVSEPGYLSRSTALSPDGAWLATGRWRSFESGVQLGDDVVTIWDWRTGEPVTTVDVVADGLAFSPDGRTLATAGLGPARLWDARSGRLLVSLAGHTGTVWDVAFSPDGATVATAGDDGTVRLWDAETGVQRLALFQEVASVVSNVQFSPDGTKLASAGDVVRVWALDLNDLLRIAQDKVTRDLTTAECRQYLHVDVCP